MTDYSTIPSPCYVLESEKLIQNLELIDSVQKRAGITIILALKGFAMFSAFPIVKKYLQGTTASSLFEAILGREEFGGELHLYSPVYHKNEFQELIKKATHISFNSLRQWQQFKEQTIFAQISPGLRINPEYSPVEQEIYNPSSPLSRLGIRAEILGDQLPEGIEGLHCHNLCESNSQALARTLEQIEMLFGHHLPHIKWLNLGGGHLITSKSYDIEHLIQVITSFKARYPHLDIYMEPGSAVAWETGLLRATVLDLIETSGPMIAMLDVSFTAHMPDCLEMPYKPRIRGARDPKEKEPTYRMGGLTCLAGDFMGMGDYYFETPLQIGDTILFEDMIHYTMVKTSMFNGVKHPGIGIIHPDGSFNLVREFDYEDYKNRLS
ncbi:carboxynorspermidine decarboxylase [Moorena sp. SIO3H5]|uniref:carboxynorspermidine decarboxylase n=1 Tax=Moorena sp. SIO3H5 TaxID=2607834 RepID=UPI0013BE0500|nr:carboxynorspermidine decarboxylase [Moorena sp. SIO3H5]NEO72323.1 carboxynorspermidine decarboxylase [Moorena sp. SIO3H5]